MRLTPSDPDIETLIGRIKSKEIDLQPDFQRGEVWGTPKKQRLIDSVLRDWHIPPIHVVLDMDTQEQSVLDGQQRLVAIRDFENGNFTVDGTLEPYDSEIHALNGLTYSSLPIKFKRKFDQFTIRVFRITDYEPSEPGELFYRLNQPSALTAAEQRNAFYGKVRNQVKELVGAMLSQNLNHTFWGFSNARMSYDDVIARSCLVLDNGTLKKKISSNTLADQYRTNREFSVATVDSVRNAIELLGSAVELTHVRPKLNKATAQSWLIFLSSVMKRSEGLSDFLLANFIQEFEGARQDIENGSENRFSFPMLTEAFGKRSLISLIRVYDDRSTSRVADTTSVILRDFVLWTTFFAYGMSKGFVSSQNDGQWRALKEIFDNRPEIETEKDVEEITQNIQWGEAL